MKNILNNLNIINERIDYDPELFVAETEQNYRETLLALAKQVSDPDTRAIIALAGPSGSGKTTTAAMLCKILSETGIKAEMISLDDFYLGLKRTPVDENGKRDYESVTALDLPLLKECLTELDRTGECDLPVFDFNLSEPAEHKRHISLGKSGVAIIEGLHAINPLLTDVLHKNRVVKLFVNVDNRIVDDSGETLFTRRDLRLMRRSSRDEIHRNSSLSNTLKMWPDVVVGERKNLFPYKGNADYIVNSFHPYELALFKDRMIRFIEELEPTDPGYKYVERIKLSLEKTAGMDQTLLPADSLLREFI